MKLSELLARMSEIELSFMVFSRSKRLGLSEASTNSDYKLLELIMSEPIALGYDFGKSGGILCSKAIDYVRCIDNTVSGFSKHFNEGYRFGSKELEAK